MIDSSQIGISGISYSFVSNCYIGNNIIGVDSSGAGNIFDHDTIILNTQYGMKIGPNTNSVIHCLILKNGKGLLTYGNNLIQNNYITNNSIGIEIGAATPNNAVSCNRICGNSQFNMLNGSADDLYFPENWWCETDTSIVAAGIYDRGEDPLSGTIYFLPMDTMCTLITGADADITKEEITVYPNPFHGRVHLSSAETFCNTTFILQSAEGQTVMQSVLNNSSTYDLDLSELPKGVFILSVRTDKGLVAVKKLIAY